jgi:hypothetical protein
MQLATKLFAPAKIRLYDLSIVPNQDVSKVIRGYQLQDLLTGTAEVGVDLPDPLPAWPKGPGLRPIRSP